jgi:carboxylesterase type B
MGPIAQTWQGQVEGVIENGAHRFLRIPYAAPPQGTLPQSDGVNPWPRYDPDDPRIAVIADRVMVQPFPVTEVMTIINSLRTQAASVTVGDAALTH